MHSRSTTYDTYLFQQLLAWTPVQKVLKHLFTSINCIKILTLLDAPYWSEAQRQFLSEKIASDGEWAIVVDQLNESLHENATSEG